MLLWFSSQQQHHLKNSTSTWRWGFFCPCLHPDTIQVMQVSIVILTDSQTSWCIPTGKKLFLSNVISLLQQRDWHENWVQSGDQVINIWQKINLQFNLDLDQGFTIRTCSMPFVLKHSFFFSLTRYLSGTVRNYTWLQHFSTSQSAESIRYLI